MVVLPCKCMQIRFDSWIDFFEICFDSMQHTTVLYNLPEAEVAHAGSCAARPMDQLLCTYVLSIESMPGCVYTGGFLQALLM